LRAGCATPTRKVPACGRSGRTVRPVEREPVYLTRADAARILAAGATAGRTSASLVTACPYSAAGDATERVRTAAWVRGYLSGRRRAA
jgi:hypothetical protein